MNLKTGFAIKGQQAGKQVISGCFELGQEGVYGIIILVAYVGLGQLLKFAHLTQELCLNSSEIFMGTQLTKVRHRWQFNKVSPLLSSCAECRDRSLPRLKQP